MPFGKTGNGNFYMDNKQREKNIATLEWFDALIFSLAFVSVLLIFFVRTVNVDGTSMQPTLMDGEQLVAVSIGYSPKRGDIVVVDSYINFGKPLVKRVIAVGGDTIDIDFDTGDVYINGEIIDEPYIAAPTTRAYDVTFPLTVPQGQVFLMGDNRLYSKDSRHSDIGLIDERDILGKVVLRLMPIQKAGLIEDE